MAAFIGTVMYLVLRMNVSYVGRYSDISMYLLSSASPQRDSCLDTTYLGTLNILIPSEVNQAVRQSDPNSIDGQLSHEYDIIGS